MKEDDETSNQIAKVLKPFIQDHYKEIMNDEKLFLQFKDLYFNKIKSSRYFSEEEEEIELILQSLEQCNSDLIKYFNSLKNFLAYMKINDPLIILPKLILPKNSKDFDSISFFKFSSDKFLVVDGFEKEGCPCILILHNPMITNGSFAGIKPAVITFKSIPQEFKQQPLKEFEKTLFKQKQLEIQTPNFCKEQYQQVQQQQQQSQQNSNYNIKIFKVNKADIQQTPKGISLFENQQLNLINLKKSPTQHFKSIQGEEEKSAANKLVIDLSQENEDFGNDEDDCLERESNTFQQENYITNSLNSYINSQNDYKMINQMNNNQSQSQLTTFINNTKIDQQNEEEINELKKEAEHFFQEQDSRSKNNNLSLSKNQQKPQQQQSRLQVQDINKSFDQNKSLRSNEKSQRRNNMNQSKNSKTRQNENVYDYVKFLDQNANNSRYLKCSIQFSKFLRSIVSQSPTKRNTSSSAKLIINNADQLQQINEPYKEKSFTKENDEQIKSCKKQFKKKKSARNQVESQNVPEQKGGSQIETPIDGLTNSIRCTKKSIDQNMRNNGILSGSNNLEKRKSLKSKEKESMINNFMEQGGVGGTNQKVKNTSQNQHVFSNQKMQMFTQISNNKKSEISNHLNKDIEQLNSETTLSTQRKTRKQQSPLHQKLVKEGPILLRKQSLKKNEQEKSKVKINNNNQQSSLNFQIKAPLFSNEKQTKKQRQIISPKEMNKQANKLFSK